MYFFETIAQVARPGCRCFQPCWSRWSHLSKFGRLFTAIIIFFSSNHFILAAGSISLSTDQTTATAGYFHLVWGGLDSPDTIYIVEETTGKDSQHRSIYQGTDTATVISGKPDGQYSYRVHTLDGEHYSNQQLITVKHHSLTAAFNFFWIGAVVFIFILVAVLRGDKQLTGKK